MTKGLEPVVGSVILIAIVIAVGIVIYSWQQSLTQSQIQQASALAECSFVSLVVDDITINDTSKRGNIIVRNVGSKTAQIAGSELYNKAAASAKLLDVMPVELAVSSVKTLSFDTSNVPCSDFSFAVVRTSCPGVQARFSAPARCV